MTLVAHSVCGCRQKVRSAESRDRPLSVGLVRSKLTTFHSDTRQLVATNARSVTGDIRIGDGTNQIERVLHIDDYTAICPQLEESSRNDGHTHFRVCAFSERQANGHPSGGRVRKMAICSDRNMEGDPNERDASAIVWSATHRNGSFSSCAVSHIHTRTASVAGPDRSPPFSLPVEADSEAE